MIITLDDVVASGFLGEEDDDAYIIMRKRANER